MAGVVQSNPPVIFEELDGSLSVSGPSDGFVVHEKISLILETIEGRSTDEGAACVGTDQGSHLGIEGRKPPKAAVLTAKFGGKFPCNLR